MDPNTRQVNGETALMLAAERGFADVAKSLLEKGAEIEARDKNGCTALMHSRPMFCWFSPSAEAQMDECRHDERRHDRYFEAEFNRRAKEQADIVRLLVKKGADIDATDEGGDTTLMQAALDMFPYDVQVVRALLEQNANVHVTNAQGRNALALAVLFEGGSAEIIEALLKKGADPNSKLPVSDLCNQMTEGLGHCNEMSVLIWAVMFGREEVVKLLLSYHADRNHMCSDGVTALHLAAYRGDTQIVKRLISSKRANLARDGVGARSLASERGFQAIVQTLIGCGVPDEGSRQSTIDLATLTEHVEGRFSRARALDQFASDGVRARIHSVGRTESKR